MNFLASCPAKRKNAIIEKGQGNETLQMDLLGNAQTA